VIKDGQVEPKYLGFFNWEYMYWEMDDIAGHHVHNKKTRNYRIRDDRCYWSRHLMICFAILVGCDYTEGFNGVGPVVARDIIVTFNTCGTDCIENFQAWLYNEDTSIYGTKYSGKLLEFTRSMKHRCLRCDFEVQEKECSHPPCIVYRELRQRNYITFNTKYTHRRVRWRMRAVDDVDSIFDAFMNPTVTKGADVPLDFPPIDVDKVDLFWDMYMKRREFTAESKENDGPKGETKEAPLDKRGGREIHGSAGYTEEEDKVS
jgi:hypothetical protein